MNKCWSLYEIPLKKFKKRNHDLQQIVLKVSARWYHRAYVALKINLFLISLKYLTNKNQVNINDCYHFPPFLYDQYNLNGLKLRINLWLDLIPAYIITNEWHTNWFDLACESSFSTETVMQVCHGKRRCSLTASSSTFGNPCSPHSHLYLRVVYTCGKNLDYFVQYFF